MLEPLIRANINRLQGLYNYVPPPGRDLLASARGWFLARIRYAPGAEAILRELRAHERWGADEIAACFLKGIRETFERARRDVPFYAGYPSIGIEGVKDLQRLPILEREIVRQRPQDFFSRAVPSHRRIRAGTTGTTGANLKVAYTEELARQNWAFLLRQWTWAGVAPREPRVTLFGSQVVPAWRQTPPFWVYNRPDRQALLSIFHISEKTASAYLDFLRAHQAEVLEGFASVLGILADFILARGESIPMRVVFTTGEPLYPSTRKKIESAFQSRVFDSYGMTEYCGLIQECEQGQMHLAPEYGYLEILDEHGQPAPSGQEGDFVWTGFLNHAMPLIRYRIGDRGRWEESIPCACGRAFPRVVPTITRQSDVLRCADGRLFSPRALNQLLKETSSMRFCQFVHDRKERVIVRVVPGNNHAFEEMMQVRSRLQALLGDGMQVTAELAAAPLARPGGKHPLILNRVEQ